MNRSASRTVLVGGMMLGLGFFLGHTTNNPAHAQAVKGAPPPAQPQTKAPETTASVEAELRRLKSEVVQAYIRRDADALARIYSDDYTVTDAQGKTRTKADELKSLKEDTEDRLESGRYELVQVRVFGDVAVASGHGTLNWKTQKGQRESRYYSFNVFARRDGRWQYVAAFTP